MSSATTASALTRLVDGREVPIAGTYELDPDHTTVAFVARHLMVTKVRGQFRSFRGSFTITEDVAASAAEVHIDAASIDTRSDDRDGHLRSADFLDVERYPELVFRTTGVEPGRGDTWRLTGDLTIRDVTRPVVLDVEFDGAAIDPDGPEKVAFSARTEIDREDWGMTWNALVEGGGVLVSKKVTIELDVQAIRVA